MDLRSSMEDVSLTNLKWLNDPETYRPKGGKDIDKKDDLEIEWNSSVYIPADKRPPTTIKDEMDIELPWRSAEACVEAARVLMNQGIMGKALLFQLRSRFLEETIANVVPELRQLLDFEGIIGCVAVDLRGDEKLHVNRIKAASTSPFKKFIKFVLMTPEQVSGSSHVERRFSTNTTMKKGSIDDLLSSKDETTEIQIVYKPLNMPVLLAAGPHEELIDEDYLGDSVVDLSNAGYLSEDEAEEIKAQEGTPIKRLKKAFQRAVENRVKAQKEKQFSSLKAKDHAKDYTMERSEMDVQFGNDPKPELKGVQLTDKRSPFEAKMTLESTDQQVEEMEHVPTLGLFDVDEPIVQKAAQEVNEFVPQLEIELSNSAILDEIDPSQHLAKEFEGTDKIDLDKIKKPQDLDFELGDANFDIGKV